ncbi:MAG: putative DNA binding domain-containing protein, partial [Lentisphaeria bacterium]|nr:putative DNA binding domain-containing protein [Lentisphaeria bacterium]
MDGYKYCKEILEHPHGGVKALMERAENSERPWLEFKASIQLLKEHVKEGYKPEDLYWEIAKAVIAMMNTYGGAVIIGINDQKPH